MCRIFPIHDTSKRQSTLAEVFVGDPSEVGVGTGSNAVAGPVVGRHAGAHELTRRFDICKASADRSPRADTLAATDRRVCANQSPASGLIWAESPASPRQVERTCAACRSGCGHRAWLPGVRLSRSAIGTGYGRQHDRICDRCDLADERMSAQGQTVGPSDWERPLGPWCRSSCPACWGCFQSVFPRPLADPDVRACGAPGFTVAVRREPHIQRTVSE